MARMYFGKTLMSPHTVDEKEVAKTKFGASIDTWIGDLDENGTLNQSTWTGALNFAGIKIISANGLYYAFNRCAGITSVDLSSLQSVGTTGLYCTFDGCTGLTSVDLSSLQSVGSNGLYCTFRNCTGIIGALDLSSLQSVDSRGLSYTLDGCAGITSVDLSSLQSVGTYGLANAFDGCAGITSVDLSSLQSVDSTGLYYAFYNCTKLTAISFPSLTSVQTNSFALTTSSGAFRNCTALTEIHFRADMQTTIEAMTGYSNKWGATNATIYFDLIGTITVNGVAYARDEKQSIRVDGVKTFVGWKDANDNVVYTSYENNAEPVVDMAVYSDQGTTQAGTVEAVA